jgi:uncharacterized protein (TIGR02246 family)
MIVHALIILAASARQQPPAGADTVAARRAILRLEADWREAQRHNDTTAFRRLLAPDLTFIGTSGSFRDRAGYTASRAGSWIPQAGTFTASELRVRVFGNAAVVTGKESAVVAGATHSIRFTDVWVSRGGTWQLAAVQRTEVGPP